MIEASIFCGNTNHSSIMQTKQTHHIVDNSENQTAIEQPSTKNKSQSASSLANTVSITLGGHTIHEHPTHHSPTRSCRNVNQNTLSVERNNIIRIPSSHTSSHTTSPGARSVSIRDIHISSSSSESSSIESIIDSLTATSISTRESTKSHHCTNDTDRMKRLGDTTTDRILRKEIQINQDNKNQMEQTSASEKGRARSCTRPDNWYASSNRSYEYDSDSDTYPMPNSPGNRNQQGQHNSPIMSPANIPVTPTTPSSRTCTDAAKFLTPQNQRITTSYSDSDHDSVDTSPSDAIQRLQLGAAPIKKKTNNPRRFQTDEERDLAIGCLVKNLFSG